MGGLFALRYAVRSLRRGGQRTLLAAVCVAFGVLALVSMQLLAAAVGTPLTLEARQRLGGDALLTRQSNQLGAAQLAELERLRADGVIARYALVASAWPGFFKPEGRDEVIDTGMAYGVDPAQFPLLGELALRDAGGLTAAQALAAPGDIIVTRSLADANGLAVGDQLIFGRRDGRAPARLRIGGIAARTPDLEAGNIYYSLETARMLGGAEPVSEAAILWGAGGPQIERLEAAGWVVIQPGGGDDQRVADVFGLMLKGAGLLGLLVGGIGVANTMQVVLARRRNEIAALKTLGYRQRDLLAQFGLEAALLGLAGSLAGAAAAAAFSARLVRMLENTGAFLLEPAFSPAIIGGGVLIGVATTLIFGAAAIIRSSAVRPAVLLRELPLDAGREAAGARGAAAGLYGLLGLLFAALAGAVMGGPLEGVAATLGALVLLGLLGLLFAGLVTLAAWLPLPGPLLRMARVNLRRDRRRSAFGLIALAMGVFAIGFAAATISSARARVAARESQAPPQRLWIEAEAAAAPRIAEQLRALGLPASQPPATAPVSAANPADPDLIPASILLAGYAGPPPQDEWLITAGAASEAPDAVLVPAWLAEEQGLGVGDRLALRGAAGTADATIAGLIAPRDEGARSEILGRRELAERLGGAQAAVTYELELPTGRLAEATAALNAALPGALIYNQAQVNEVFMRVFAALLAFVVATAGLACVAGGVLIANTVGLAMVERRRELGILKAVGYPSGSLLLLIALENAILGLLAGGAGMAAVAVAVRLVNRLEGDAGLALRPGLAAAMVGAAIALAVCCALAVAWGPARRRPLAQLRAD